MARKTWRDHAAGLIDASRMLGESQGYRDRDLRRFVREQTRWVFATQGSYPLKAWRQAFAAALKGKKPRARPAATVAKGGPLPGQMSFLD